MTRLIYGTTLAAILVALTLAGPSPAYATDAADTARPAAEQTGDASSGTGIDPNG